MRRAWIGGMAAGGVIATHLLTFALLAPDAHARADLLARSGHGSFTAVAAVAMGLLAAATAHFCLRAAAATDQRGPLPFASTAVSLAGVQAVGWLVLEAAERALHAGAHWEPRAFALGLVVQTLIAVAGAVVLKALHRAVRVVVRCVRSARRRRPIAAPAAGRGHVRNACTLPTLRPAVLAGATGLRGPPSCS